jgi:hypothetical protein
MSDAISPEMMHRWAPPQALEMNGMSTGMSHA